MSGTNEMCFTSGMDDYITKVLWKMIFCSKLTPWHAILISFFSSPCNYLQMTFWQKVCLLKNMWWVCLLAQEYVMSLLACSRICDEHDT
jgi:hypothetical protein